MTLEMDFKLLLLPTCEEVKGMQRNLEKRLDGVTLPFLDRAR